MLPSLNPDGFKRSREGCTFLSKYVLSQNFIMKQDLWRLVSRMFNAGTAARLNARGVDLNRDFPKQFDESVFGLSFEELGRNEIMLPQSFHFFSKNMMLKDKYLVLEGSIV